MAEINTAATSNRKAGVHQSKKLSTRVDLTPMVDLGFLLITFFIFTNNMSKPMQMKLNIPADGPNTQAGESGALTVLLAGGNKVFYYHGELSDALAKGHFGITNYSVNEGIGQVIRDKQTAMDSKKPGFRKDLVLMIKATDESSYQNLVDLLDECVINMVGRHAIMDITKAEIQALATHLSASPQ